jgi:3-methylcrotonyl-CoA carboxylase beta subunit
VWDDGVIDPHDTRMVLALGLAAALHAPWPERRQSVYRM